MVTALTYHACGDDEDTEFWTHGGVIRVIGGLLNVELLPEHLANACVFRWWQDGSTWKVTIVKATFYIVPTQHIEPYPVLDDMGPIDEEASIKSRESLGEGLHQKYALPLTAFHHIQTLKGHATAIAEEETGKGKNAVPAAGILIRSRGGCLRIRRASLDTKVC